MLSTDRSPRRADRLVAAGLKPASRTLLALAATSAVAAALAPASASAAQPCVASHAGPGNGTWKIDRDGALSAALQVQPGPGSVFEAGYGTLAVNGVLYAKELDDDACLAEGTTLSFPAQNVGGLLVSRKVTVVDGVVQHLDTITNATDKLKFTTADFKLAVLGSQGSVASEDGNASVDSDDHWAVLSSNDNAFPFIRWGAENGNTPQVDPADPDLTVWEPDAGVMDDATLRYSQIVLEPGRTVHLLHWSGATTALADATAAVQNGGKPFTGLSTAVAQHVLNWGPDPDGDGVTTFSDACPSVKGNTANGCLLIAPPKPVDSPDPGTPTPDPGTPAPAPQPQPGGGGVPAPAADRRAPRLTLAGLSARAKRSQVTRRGLRPRITCDEACTLTVKVTGRKKVGKRVRTVVLKTVTPAGRTVEPRTVALRLTAGTLRGVRGGRLRVELAATDGSGNTTRTARTVTVAR